jgi:glutamine amidotransferase
MQRLNESGMRPKLEELVLGAQVPVMGICVGMQMLAQGSDEGQFAWPELGAWSRKGICAAPKSAICPCHTWAGTTLQPACRCKLFSKGFEEAPQFYFLHSYSLMRKTSRCGGHGHYGLTLMR